MTIQDQHCIETCEEHSCYWTYEDYSDQCEDHDRSALPHSFLGLLYRLPRLDYRSLLLLQGK